tara:strand:+ start:2604 stop:3035 length:432 start_codon:yes stop_codon:yes gene_type:complete
MKFRTALVLPVLLAACSQAEDKGATSAEAVDSAGAETAQAAGLTPAYLEGQWCFSHLIISGERSDERINYIFSPDGTLLYQTNSATEIEQPGSYVIDANSIKIKPTLAFMDMQLESLSQDLLVFKTPYGEMYWARGACVPQPQ